MKLERPRKSTIFFWQESSNLASHKTAIPLEDLLTFSQQCSDISQLKLVFQILVFERMFIAVNSLSHSGNWLMQWHHLG